MIGEAPDESSGLLLRREDYPSLDPHAGGSPHGRLTLVALKTAFVAATCTFALALTGIKHSLPRFWAAPAPPSPVAVPVLGADRKTARWHPPEAARRCEWVESSFRERDARIGREELIERYDAQSTDPNVFYRATAHIFWRDFAGVYPDGIWDDYTWEDIGVEESDEALYGDLPLDEKSTWTWVTGDQHLSNFGAWRNRRGRVVFSVNDFDEAALYDFRVDVLRLAVSVCSHAVTNGLSDSAVDDALEAFTKAYVKTVESYVGNEDALLFEMTADAATGKLRRFLEDIEDDNSKKKQMKKFTEVDEVTGVRRFVKDAERTRLVSVPADVEAAIRGAFTSRRYGATMMKLGWNTHDVWDDDFFTVLDVAARVGSGVGSFGVDRYYVLLKGEDRLLGEDGKDGSAVILDVKYEPKPAVAAALSPDDAAWYRNLFPNEAARAFEGQRRLTTYTDPFIGWVMLPDDDSDSDSNSGASRPFYIRQRSPWKESFDLDDLTKKDDYIEFVEHVATITATSHTRGTVSKAPGEFKHVIAKLLGDKPNRKAWGRAVAEIARAYRKQVLLDFQCFKEFVAREYSA